MAKPDIQPGGRVRLRCDVTTNGGVKFRAGVVMRVVSTAGEYYLRVVVRGRRHTLLLKKKNAYLLELVSPPPTKE